MGDTVATIKNRIVGYGSKPASQFQAHPNNWRKHPQNQRDAVAASLREVGWVGVVLENVRTGHLVDGHERVWQALQADDAEVPYVQVDLSPEEEALVLATLDPITGMAQADADKLAELLADVQTGEQALLDLIVKEAERAGIAVEPESTESEEPDLERADVPDALFPTDNEWGVPLLDVRFQAKSLDLPALVWGELSRKTRMQGTWLFYTEDYRYEAIWADPSPVVNTRCVNAVEPNFSVYDQMPRAVALWAIYRKRWIARWWQACGVRIFADLNVAECHADLNMLGIPQGWRAWATRGYTERMDATVREYERAVAHAGSDDILFVVYGGGKKVQAMCGDHGWVWVPERMQSYG